MRFDIRQATRGANSAANQVNRVDNKINNETNNSNDFWTGVAKDAFQRSCDSRQRELAGLTRILDHLVDALSGVDSSVREADENRRLEAERMRRESQKKANGYTFY